MRKVLLIVFGHPLRYHYLMNRVVLVLLVLLSASPVAAQDCKRWVYAFDEYTQTWDRFCAKPDPVLKVAAIFTGSLAGADMAVSMDAFARGQAREANPLLRPLVSRPWAFGAVKGAFDAGAVWGIYELERDPNTVRRRVIALAIVALKAGVVAWNLRELRRR
jgi:hypothetical protein